MLENEADPATAEGTGNTTDDTTAPEAARADATGEETASGVTGVTSRPRRRASRPAGPPPDVEEAPATAAPPEAAEEAAPEAAAEPVVAEPAAEKAAPPKRAARTRTRAKKAETAEPVPMTGAETSPEKAAAESVPETATAPAPETAATAPGEPAAEVAAAPAAEQAPVTRTRTRRRAATAGPITPPEPDETAVPSVPRVPVVPTVPVAAAEPVAGEAPEIESIGIPGVTFQPPMVVFQPPTPSAEPPARPQAEPAEPAEPAESEAEAVADESDEDEDEDRPSRRRRRRGGRGRGRGKDAADEGADDEQEEPAEAEEPEEPARPAKGAKSAKSAKATKAAKAAKAAEEAESDEDEDDDEEGGAGSSRRRRRRRRRSGGDGEQGTFADDPPNTVVHVRSGRAAEPRAAEDEVQSVRGSTRLEAKKQRRREGREQGRRRPPVITEAEFLARREAVDRVMVLRQEGERTQIAVLEDGVLVEHYINRSTHQSYVGNVYLGKVQNVLPSMEAAFVDIGKGRNAVLYAGEVNWDASGLEGQPRRIESALKSGQSVLVQVTKDPLGHKGARLTSQVSLPGRYLVYVPDGSMTGISRKLPDKERSRLKSILKKIMPDNAGVIVRTAAEGATEEELSRDVSRLAAQWESIQKKVKTASAPALLHGEPDMTIRVVRDIFNEDFGKLVVSGAEAWDTVSEYVEYVAPHLADRVERWTDEQDVLTAFRIDEQIAKALDRKVWLPSGGSLVIDRTEAMIVVDVNTGKFTGQGGNLEETVTRNNLEAAEEIVRQLRLRDIGGIVVIDFIDMVLESNRDLVLRRLVECLSRDRTKHQVAEVTSLGLVQMTRKRVGQGLVEAFSEVCESCNGRGIHVQLTPVEMKTDKAAAKEGGAGGGRRRKRKGEVEKAVEEKITRQEKTREAPEPEPAAEAAPEPAPEPEPAPAVRTRPRRSGPAKRPAGPPPDVEAEEPPVQAAVEAEDAAAEVAGTSPGILDDETEAVPVTAEANGAAPARKPAGEPAADAEEETGNGRRRRSRRTRAVQVASAGEAGDPE
ncbi:Rne/Rng family ribonuclease [Spirillospora albida]|uniref:Rne/Rng family ribonuclease n=1 Tax=Spirillospora albida TaxID=58123 RepID=UPI0004BE4F7C|nr:Rne/Rng family ribonuclease [Spirillospora albida]